MEDDTEKVLRLLRQKLAALQQILEITQGAELTPSVEGADAYVDMVNKRGVVFDDLKNIEDSLDPDLLAHVRQADNDAFSMEAERINRQAKAAALKIMRCDEENRANCRAIMDYLKKNMKDISNQKNVNTYYQYGASPADISYFDKQK